MRWLYNVNCKWTWVKVKKKKPIYFFLFVLLEFFIVRPVLSRPCMMQTPLIINIIIPIFTPMFIENKPWVDRHLHQADTDTENRGNSSTTLSFLSNVWVGYWTIDTPILKHFITVTPVHVYMTNYCSNWKSCNHCQVNMYILA